MKISAGGALWHIMGEGVPGICNTGTSPPNMWQRSRDGEAVSPFTSVEGFHHWGGGLLKVIGQSRLGSGLQQSAGDPEAHGTTLKFSKIPHCGVDIRNV